MKSNITSEVVSFAKITTYGGARRLLIEKYQRPYAWGVEEIEALFQDHFLDIPQRRAAKAENPDVEFADPFVGSIVLLPRTHKEHGVCMEVIDGQQRTTTLSLVLAMAVRRLSTLGEPIHPEAKQILFVDPECRVTRLCPKEQDRENYERAVALSCGDAEIQKLTRAKEKDLRVSSPNELARPSLRAHAVIQSCMQNYLNRASAQRMPQKEALQHLVNTIVSELRIVAVSVDGYSQGMAVFEALNARGQPLTVDQLFKNVLMLTFTEANDQDAIEQFWEGPRLSFESMLPKPSHRDKFLLHYHRAFFGHIQKRMLYGSFRKIAQGIRSSSASSRFKGLQEFLDHFRENCRFIARDYPPALKTLGAEVVRPALMAVREYFSRNEELASEAVKRAAFVFECALIRISVCGTGIGRLDANIATLAQEILSGARGSTPAAVAEGIRSFLSSPAIDLPDDATFKTKLLALRVDIAARRDALLLARLHQYVDVGISNCWQSEPDQSKYGLRWSMHGGTKPSESKLSALGYADMQAYESSVTSIGNVVVTPPGAQRAGSYEVNKGLPTEGASSSEILAMATKRADYFLRIYKIT